MKKFLAIILALAFCVSALCFVSCEKQDGSTDTDLNQSNESNESNQSNQDEQNNEQPNSENNKSPGTGDNTANTNTEILDKEQFTLRKNLGEVVENCEDSKSKRLEIAEGVSDDVIFIGRADYDRDIWTKELSQKGFGVYSDRELYVSNLDYVYLVFAHSFGKTTTLTEFSISDSGEVSVSADQICYENSSSATASSATAPKSLLIIKLKSQAVTKEITSVNLKINGILVSDMELLANIVGNKELRRELNITDSPSEINIVEAYYFDRDGLKERVGLKLPVSLEPAGAFVICEDTELFEDATGEYIYVVDKRGSLYDGRGYNIDAHSFTLENGVMSYTLDFNDKYIAQDSYWRGLFIFKIEKTSLSESITSLNATVNKIE